LDNFVRFLKPLGFDSNLNFLELEDKLAIFIDRIVNYKAKVNQNIDCSNLDVYFEARRELEDSHKLATPSDIKDWDAAWIDREGKIYGANGTIANFLHLNIADTLAKHGIIPKSKEKPDIWLEKNGWVKMQKNWVMYAGYYGIYSDILPLTDTQIQTISNIGNLECYNYILIVGDKKVSMPAAQFKTMDKLMLQNLFKL
jgi:hypothetical protein